jgi:signal transduction histidine kinase
VSIEDDGAGATAAANSGGHGLRGMRERAAMLGGAVNAGPREQGGYRVSATLPYPDRL